MQEPDTTQINCPIDLFQPQEKKMQTIIQEINISKDINEKASYANKLQKEVDVLLECKSYDEKNLNCKGCQTIAGLRKNVVDIILKTAKVAGMFNRNKK
jgi:hypothetical protein